MRLILPALALTGLLAACATTSSEPPAPDANETAAPATPPANAPAPAAGEQVPMPAGLNSEERFIWSTLTPQAKRQAAEFIANGGTLLQFVNA